MTKESRKKPFGTPPSPTLTNPDLVLPNESRKSPMLPSPPRTARRDRPPSPSYLRHQSSDVGPLRNAGVTNPAMSAAKKEKRGLMSRKMMLLRSRTASSGYGVQLNGDGRQGSVIHNSSAGPLMDSNEVAGDQPGSKWSTDESEAESEDMSGLPRFLAKYNANAASATDDELEGSTAVGHHDYAPSTLAGSDDAERLQKEKDEQASAILSKRAEEILANAKKRLNLMEGNLRGARDLVTPLTAANLKRATSVASYVPPISNYGGITRYVEGSYRYNATTQKSYRTLHAQASNPVMGRDYLGHSRGFSETYVPEQTSSQLDQPSSPLTAQSSTPQKPLKGSRSHDSLGMALRQPGAREPFYTRASPDSNLEPLAEDDGPVHVAVPRSSTSSRAASRAESHRAVSTPENLHEQMHSLRGHISALKERAKEDSLRRQSMQNLGDPSPLNNATTNAPELFYTSSPTYGSPILDKKAGIGLAAQAAHSQSPAQPSEVSAVPTPILTGTRNAFAEQARRQQQQRRDSASGSAGDGPLPGQHHKKPPSASTHRRTPSGTAVVQSSKHRYSHHQYYRVQDMDDTYGADMPNGVHGEEAIGTAHDGTSHFGDDEGSAVDASVYEDTSTESQPMVVAHEDRADAFDYENFFLHSAMSYYADDPRRASASSDGSVDSVETERGPGPTADILDGYARSDGESPIFPPATPETPEKLMEIERNLHQRTFSDESVSSLATFATAVEGRESPGTETGTAMSSARVSTAMEWPVPPSSGGHSRPGTAIPVKPRQIEIPRSDSSSERADSGLGLNGIQDSLKRGQSKIPMHKSSLSSSATMTGPMSSPPMSPRTPLAKDPATVAVNALLMPHGRQLGLRDKALVFGLVECLKTVCHQLQEGEETALDTRVLRRRLDDARRVLIGGSEVRPGTS